MDPDCPKCDTNRHVRHDHNRGTIVCTRCGRVVENNVVQDTPEWHAEEGETVRARAEGLDSALMDISDSESLNRTLNVGFQSIRGIAARLDLPRPHADRANEIFRGLSLKLHAAGKRRMGKSNEHVYVACLFIGHRMGGGSRTLRDMSHFTGLDFNSLARTIQRIKATGVWRSSSGLETLIERFGFEVGLPLPLVVMARSVGAAINALGICGGHKPATVAGAALWFVGEEHPEAMASLARVTGISMETIVKLYHNKVSPVHGAIVKRLGAHAPPAVAPALPVVADAPALPVVADAPAEATALPALVADAPALPALPVLTPVSSPVPTPLSSPVFLSFVPVGSLPTFEDLPPAAVVMLE